MLSGRNRRPGTRGRGLAGRRRTARRTRCARAARGRRAPAALGHQRPVVDRLRRQVGEGPGREERAPRAAARVHPQDALRGDRPAALPRGRDAQGRRRRPGRHRRGQQPGRRAGRADVHRGGPVARGLPRVGQRRRARTGAHERLGAADGVPDAGQGRDAGCRRHPCRLARRLRLPGPGLVRVRPGAVRPRGPGEPRLRRLRLDGDGAVPGRLRRARHVREVVRHPEHQPAADRRGRCAPLPGAGRGEERLHHQRGQHPDRRRDPAGQDPHRHRDEPAVGAAAGGLHGGGQAAGLGFRRRGPHRLGGHPERRADRLPPQGHPGAGPGVGQAGAAPAATGPAEGGAEARARTGGALLEHLGAGLVRGRRPGRGGGRVGPAAAAQDGRRPQPVTRRRQGGVLQYRQHMSAPSSQRRRCWF
ncbi:hypothetical protein SBRY_70164 [Actinacidiphila bryophytorum]|uniref:Uncharacterized protein n=1 Tax=Actinacidiphila bryophytorum TaxID=1436133 RepID=A0A9W4H769_9ACTN|nr:hypothetical protein SBRY_70164 [Actinacidiphila bryophytorum]